MQETIRLTQFSKGGGCGCKIAPSVLQEIIGKENTGSFTNLLVGNDSNDDAAVYRIDGDMAVISTTDFFVPIVDDPYDFGRVAAANAISDVYAMGGQPLMAVAILGWPIDKAPVSQAQQVLQGGRAICTEARIPLAGGHTIDTTEPIFGLAVTGMISAPQLKKNNTAKEGDLLFLTKPLGTGILSTALKRGMLQDIHYAALMQQMTSLNHIGSSLGKLEGVHAMTDVTGFGLIGHLSEMAEGSGFSARLNYPAIKKLNGLDDYLKQRTIPDATFRNWNSYNQKVGFDKGINVMEAFNLLPDPQTNGGLLIAVGEEQVPQVQKLFHMEGLEGHLEPIGVIMKKADKTITVSGSL